MFRFLKWSAVLAVGFLGFLYWLGGSQPHLTLEQRADAACRKQFGSQGDLFVNQCKIQVLLKVASDRQDARFQAAIDEAR